jgi:hypothetical protein
MFALCWKALEDVHQHPVAELSGHSFVDVRQMSRTDGEQRSALQVVTALAGFGHVVQSPSMLSQASTYSDCGSECINSYGGQLLKASTRLAREHMHSVLQSVEASSVDSGTVLPAWSGAYWVRASLVKNRYVCLTARCAQDG